MDQLIDFNRFPVLNSNNTEEKLIKSIRLLSVFVNDGYNVIFATNEDIVYGIGDNTNGCLGLGFWTKDIVNPEVNQVLSHKNLVDVAIGHMHYLGLTSGGEVYSWGQNNYGELGTNGMKGCPKPTIIPGLIGKKVVQICCGSSYSMALTSDGVVYTWGRNSFHQLGYNSMSSVWLPNNVSIEEKIISICCGRIQSIALTATGRAYVWGVLKCGPTIFMANPFANPSAPPTTLPLFDNVFVRKAVCGPDFVLLLTSEGRLYSYGNNFNGQVGKGAFGHENYPIIICEGIPFKDIIASTVGSLVVGVSSDDKYYVWGLTQNSRIFSPQLVREPSLRSVFDVYTMYALNKVTFKTIVLNSDFNLNSNQCSFTQRSEDLNQWLNKSMNDLNRNKSQSKVFSPKNDILIEKNFDSDGNRTVKLTPEKSPPKTNSDNCSDKLSILSNNHQSVNQSVITQASEAFSETIFKKFLIKSFNNPKDYDLKLIFNERIIFCHKSVLKFRNNEFWNKCKNRFKNGNKYEIRIKPIYYESFLAFIQHIYGQTPEVTEDNCSNLLKMATIYGESELKDLCQQFLNTRIDLTDECPVYERGTQSKSTDFEKSFIEFMSKHIK